ncbi:MAG: MCP four helix bundle domain-containing protein [Bacteriovorax sp.]|nr:MCP four helix bundle domain-containing protein [Bacteriovorax sp.]
MKNISIKTKLLSLSGFFLFIILITNLYGNFVIRAISNHMQDISKVQLPAVRKMTLIDMYHDGFVGVVYKAIHAAQTKNDELLKDAQKSLEENSAEMRSLSKDINLLPLTQSTKNAIAEAQPAIENYLNTAKAIVELVSKGQEAEALNKLPQFNNLFSILEKKLEILGDLIQSDSAKSQLEGDESAAKGKTINLALTILSILIGIIATWMFVTSLINSLTQTVEDLSASVHSVQNTTQVMNMVSKRLTECVDTQASNITESVTAMDEISSMIQNNNNSAQKSLELSTRTKSSAESGKNTVNQMRDEMREISASYDDIQTCIIKNKEDISKIIGVINQIAEKTKVINDIVFQTKLLSFNASVEAARAGESGKGFAVVAEEVGNLAEMSGKASSEIEKMLSESQQQVKVIAESTTISISKIVEKGKVQVKRGNDISAKCFEDLEQIYSYAVNLNVSMTEISNAIKEQSIGVGEVNISLKQLDGATQESSEMSDKSKSSSENLKNQAHELRKIVQDLRKILGAKKSYNVLASDSLDT